MVEFRIEKDSMGEVKVPAQAYYGAQTQRAVENFPISGQPLPSRLIRALGQVKPFTSAAVRTLRMPPPFDWARNSVATPGNWNCPAIARNGHWLHCSSCLPVVPLSVPASTPIQASASMWPIISNTKRVYLL